MTSQKGRELHQQAETAREANDLPNALELCESAVQAYATDKDYLGLAEVLASKVLSLRHLANQLESTEVRLLAKYTAMAAVDIANMHQAGGAVALPLFTLGKVHAELEEWGDAEKSFSEALQVMQTDPPSLHNRPSYIAEMTIHHAEAKYCLGDKNALNQIDQQIEIIKASDEDVYNKDTWICGAYLAKYRLLKNDNLDLSAQALANAKTIIDANPKLVLRAQEYQRLTTIA